jgi:prolyl-tRNA synthetase
MATEAEAIQAGIVAGAASPVGLKGFKVVADDSITLATNLVAGANKPDTHIKNVNYPRDFQVDLLTDIARVKAGDTCPKCGGRLSSTHGIEVGHTFKLGTFISRKLGANFVDPSGVTRPIVMGSYGIGLGRLLAAAIEQSHDEKGIIWPMAIAPYHIYLCSLYPENAQVAEAAEKLYSDLTARGLEVLYDDRHESPGVKFNDADLLGIPLRVTISPRTLEKDSVEVKWRTEKQTQLVSLASLAATLKELVDRGAKAS